MISRTKLIVNLIIILIIKNPRKILSRTYQIITKYIILVRIWFEFRTPDFFGMDVIAIPPRATWIENGIIFLIDNILFIY